MTFLFSRSYYFIPAGVYYLLWLLFRDLYLSSTCISAGIYECLGKEDKRQRILLFIHQQAAVVHKSSFSKTTLLLLCKGSIRDIRAAALIRTLIGAQVLFYET